MLGEVFVMMLQQDGIEVAKFSGNKASGFQLYLKMPKIIHKGRSDEQSVDEYCTTLKSNLFPIMFKDSFCRLFVKEV